MRRKKWVDNISPFSIIGSPTLLNDTFTSIQSIPGLRADLYRFQKTTIRAMIDLENKDKFINATDEYVTTTDAGMISDPNGSGKTICILGVILSSHPKKWHNRPTSYGTAKIQFKTRRQTLIIANKYAIPRWKKAIQKFTDLTFEEKMGNSNIILAKNTETKLLNHHWERVVIDNVFASKFNGGNAPNAEFTWYLAARRKLPPLRQLLSKDISQNILTPRYNRYCIDPVIYHHFNIASDESHLSQLAIPKLFTTTYRLSEKLRSVDIKTALMMADQGDYDEAIKHLGILRARNFIEIDDKTYLRILERMREKTCTICYDIMKIAVVFTCGITICTRCYFTMLRASETRFVKCPTCRKFKYITDLFAIRTDLELLNQTATKLVSDIVMRSKNPLIYDPNNIIDQSIPCPIIRDKNCGGLSFDVTDLVILAKKPQLIDNCYRIGSADDLRVYHIC